MIRHRARWRLVLAPVLACQLAAASLPESIDRLIDASPMARTAFWGIQIVDLANGKTLYQRNPDHYFLPASNAKLFSTAMALLRLGPDYTFQTRITAAQPPDPDGVLHGSLRLIGGGDPNLSARAIPYRVGPISGDPLAPLADLAAQVAAHGVKRIEGDIIGDDTWYVWEPYAPGWSIDDPRSDDGAPISALTIADNAINLNVRPGPAAGEPATLQLNPPVEYYQIENRVRTVAAGGERHIRLERLPGSRNVQVWGTIPLHDRGEDITLGMEDPAFYAARALRQILEEHGISVGGDAIAQHLQPADVPNLTQAPPSAPDSAVELASHMSAPYLEDLRITDKVSENLHAELALRAVARARRNVGSFEASREEMRAFLTEIGIARDTYNLLDGSGLSRLDLVTPAAVMKLLRHMYASPQRENWISLLPIGGKDGTLSTRFTDPPVLGRIHAKTGSLSHVSALSGYAQRTNGRWVAFSVLVNNYNGPTADIRAVMDRICALIME